MNKGRMLEVTGYIIDIFRAITCFAWLIAGLLMIFSSFLDMYYASSIEDLAKLNSKSIMYMREAIENKCWTYKE